MGVRTDVGQGAAEEEQRVWGPGWGGGRGAEAGLCRRRGVGSPLRMGTERVP